MVSSLKIAVGQHTDKGRKAINQDFQGAHIPEGPALLSKGVAVALADGISSSEVSQIASAAAVQGFLADYYCTSEAWSVKRSAQRVLAATNSWLHAQTQQSQYRYDKDRGYVCTISVVVIKSSTAHLFHVGDTRIYRLHAHALEQLTEDHRVRVSSEQSYLGRALGIHPHLEIDYQSQPVEPGDTFLLMTDGVYEHLETAFAVRAIQEHPTDLDQAARLIVEHAYERGSTDNLSIQIVRVDELPGQDLSEFGQQLSGLAVPSILEARMDFDGYRIVRELYGSSRSHIYLAVDSETDQKVVIKTPSIDLQADPAYLERLQMEEWVARRVNSAHVLKAFVPQRKRHHLYVAMEYVEGQTLAQWMIDHPRPDLETVRGIVEQIAKGLQAFHRMEMLHQDVRPANIMIDSTGTVKIIDFGSAQVAGLKEMASPAERDPILGTAQYTAPEYFLGDSGTPRSDLFSLGVIAYQMFTGRLPYGVAVSQTRSLADQKRLLYRSVLDEERALPVWIDGVLRKALHPDPSKRYEEVSEFAYDLRHPNREFLNRNRPALIERNPLAFWKTVSLALALCVLLLLGLLALARSSA